MDGLSFLEFATQHPMSSGALINPIFSDLQLKWIHLCLFSPAVFWGDIALDEEDLKLFHIDKARDWIKQSVEEGGHSTGTYCVPHFLSLGRGVRDPGKGGCGLQDISI